MIDSRRSWRVSSSAVRVRSRCSAISLPTSDGESPSGTCLLRHGPGRAAPPGRIVREAREARTAGYALHPLREVAGARHTAIVTACDLLHHINRAARATPRCTEDGFPLGPERLEGR